MASLVKRGKNYYLQWRVGGKNKRRSLQTDSKQISARFRSTYNSIATNEARVFAKW